MKVTTIAMVLLCLAIAKPLSAQEKESNCDSNFKQALTFLKEDKSSTDDQTFAINLLKPCASNGHVYAKVLLGTIYEASATNKEHRKAFKLYKEAAKSGNAIAMFNLGVLYKNGKGCQLNYNKARKWFEKSAEQGNEMAIYSLGYMYLKGLGSIDQDYNKAVSYFEKSEYAMAKYWLGVCYLNGYGVSKNIQKANELLETNFDVTNSSTAVDTDSQQSTNAVSESSITTTTNATANTVDQESLLGSWKGKLIQLDWSKTTIVKKIDFELTIKKDEQTGTLVSSIVSNNQTINDDVLLLDNTLYFDNTNITLPHTGYKESIPTALAYQLLSGDIQLKSFEGVNYLTANIDSYIPKWNESGVPTRLVLKKVVGFANSDKELSDDALKALSEQEESFIKLYPNPFVNDVIVSYNLETQANVQVEITDLSGNSKAVLATGKTQTKGEHRYFFNASQLQKGAYIVSVTVNGERKTRVIVKK